MMTEQEVTWEMDRMGVDVLEPTTKRERTMAHALEAFSSFVLEEEMEQCQSIIHHHMDTFGDSSSAGALQGGSEEHEIYRLLIPMTTTPSTMNHHDDSSSGGGGTKKKKKDAACELLQLFHDRRRGYQTVLTMETLQHYMLGMCDRRSQTRRTTRRYSQLGNVMFILTFGATHGQIRHIDKMDPNLQICLYMSHNCPSTIVYSMDGPPITNTHELLQYWEATATTTTTENQESHVDGMGFHETVVHVGVVPELVKDMLEEQGDAPLGTHKKTQPHTKFFAFWDTMNSHLQCFGKLYKPVVSKLSLQTEPGTTLISPGNEVHAGPPTVGPRMFAFAIGIPDETNHDNDHNDDDDDDDGGGGGDDYDEDNNGEIQYNPVLLHVDLCCILFGMMEFHASYAERNEEHASAKRFLLSLLLPFLKEYPNENYTRLMTDNRRSQVFQWLRTVSQALLLVQHENDYLQTNTQVNQLLQEAIDSDSMFYSPDVVSGKYSKKRRSKKKKTRTATIKTTGT